ncbi:MAG: DMT family transporter [Anaerolineae bacterium]|nr:DMT family transporter [Anaerolineae bacterium]
MLRLPILIWLIILSLLWGPAFLFIKVAVQEVPPLSVAAVRVGLGAVLLYLILRWQGRSLPKPGSVWKHFIVMGITSNAIPFFLLNWSQQYIDSALAAILVGTMPLFTILLANFLTVDDTFSMGKVVGVVIGFGGLVVLFLPALLDGVQATVWGLSAAIGASISYSYAFIYARQRLRGLPPLVAPTAQLLTASLCLVPLALLIERPFALPLPSWPVISALLLVTILSTVLAFVLYYRVMERTNATTMSVVTYLNPIVATILGGVVLNEALAWNGYLGATLILMSALAINGAHVPAGWWRIGRQWRRMPAKP